MNPSFSNKKIVTIGLFAFLLLSLPVVIFVLQKQEDIRQHASSLTPTPSVVRSCPAAPVDTMLIMDVSGSMNDKLSSTDTMTKLSAAKAAATTFVNNFLNNTTAHLGLVKFSSTSTTMSSPVDVPLTTNFSSVKTSINALTANGSTCIECGIVKATNELTAHGRANVKKVYVLLSDGRANATVKLSSASTSVAEKAASDAAQLAYTSKGVTLYTIGLGKDVNTTFLQHLATSTGGQYFFSPSSNDLNAIYATISRILVKGSVTGYAYNDLNKNGIMEDNEPKLTGWTITVKDSSGLVVSSTTTNENGAYSLPDLCDGTYTVSETVQSGWTQTSPTNPATFTITVSNGSSAENKNFGNTHITRCNDSIDNDANGFTDAKDSTCHTDGNPNNSGSYDPNKDGEHGGNTCADSKDNNGNNLIDGADPICHTDGNPNNPGSYDPNLPESSPTPTPTTVPTVTPTPKPTFTPVPTFTLAPTTVPTPSDTTFNLTVFLHGIGNSGDNRNPASDLSNKKPLHPQRNALVEIFDNSNQLIASKPTVLQYASTSGNFLGSVTVGAPLTSGTYTIKITSDQHLRNQYPGIQAITTGHTITMAPISLVAGDVNGDNKLDILDYNILYGCYTSDLMPTPRDCTGDNSVKADLDDEGHVNLFDLNLFIRELSVQSGL